MSVDDVVRVTSTILATYSERFMSFGHDIAPMLPQEMVPIVVPLLETYITRQLTGISEELQRKVLPQAATDDM